MRASPLYRTASKQNVAIFMETSNVAYGKLLPDEVIHAARFGAVNLHGSLLPKYRG
ncbi:MAG: methionyl-tRNA formyltransferase, partial [Desulfovibrio sp.]|nr:methionyl-tRNA formyltransferase [Desulfovibrio sp.]